MCQYCSTTVCLLSLTPHRYSYTVLHNFLSWFGRLMPVVGVTFVFVLLLNQCKGQNVKTELPAISRGTLERKLRNMLIQILLGQ